MFQKVTIVGNLGSDPETRFTQSGTNVCSFSVATNRRWTNSDGSKGEETVWWRVSAWGKLGEICQQYLSKGRQVFIEGEITPDRETGGPRIWQDANGGNRASFEIRASTMQMLGGRDDTSGSYDNSNYQEPQQQQAPRQAPAQQRQAAPQQSARQAPPQQARQAPAAGGNRRSTASTPQNFEYDEIDPDEIPF